MIVSLFLAPPTLGHFFFGTQVDHFRNPSNPVTIPRVWPFPPFLHFPYKRVFCCPGFPLFQFGFKTAQKWSGPSLKPPQPNISFPPVQGLPLYAAFSQSFSVSKIASSTPGTLPFSGVLCPLTARESITERKPEPFGFSPLLLSALAAPCPSGS